MKLLRIENSSGQYRDKDGEYRPVDKLNKEGLLHLVNTVLAEGTVDFDEFDDSLIKNQAHQIVYKSVFRKLHDLRKRRSEFVDESKRTFLEVYEKYRAARQE